MMSFTETSIPGAWVIELDPRVDERGFFVRAWDAAAYVSRGIDPTIVQMNMSQSAKAGTLRGFHWQEAPHGETKTFRCIAGETFNVIVDTREDSPAFGQWFGARLSPTNLKMLCVPEGVANGFLSMEDESRVLYQVSSPYSSEAVERGLRFDDPFVKVDWPIPVTITSAKDQSWPDFRPSVEKGTDPA